MTFVFPAGFRAQPLKPNGYARDVQQLTSMIIAENAEKKRILLPSTGPANAEQAMIQISVRIAENRIQSSDLIGNVENAEPSTSANIVLLVVLQSTRIPMNGYVNVAQRMLEYFAKNAVNPTKMLLTLGLVINVRPKISEHIAVIAEIRDLSIRTFGYVNAEQKISECSVRVADFPTRKTSQNGFVKNVPPLTQATIVRVVAQNSEKIQKNGPAQIVAQQTSVNVVQNAVRLVMQAFLTGSVISATLKTEAIIVTIAVNRNPAIRSYGSAISVILKISADIVHTAATQDSPTRIFGLAIAEPKTTVSTARTAADQKKRIRTSGPVVFVPLLMKESIVQTAELQKRSREASGLVQFAVLLIRQSSALNAETEKEQSRKSGHANVELSILINSAKSAETRKTKRPEVGHANAAAIMSADIVPIAECRKNTHQMNGFAIAEPSTLTNTANTAVA